MPRPFARALVASLLLLSLSRCGGGDADPSPQAPGAAGAVGMSAAGTAGAVGMGGAVGMAGAGGSGAGGEATGAGGGAGGEAGEGGAGGEGGAVGEGGMGGEGGGGPSVSCALGVLGDLSKPIELSLTVRQADGVSVPLVDGGEVPLITPPQGGRVILVGVRATNVVPCSVKLSAAFRDIDSGQVRVDARTINLKPQADGFGTSVDANMATFAHVPMCPNQWASGDIYGRAYELEVSLTDKAGRSQSAKMKLTPFCSEPSLEAECKCICKQGYVLGAACD